MNVWATFWALALLVPAAQAQPGSGPLTRLEFRFGRVVLATGDTLDGSVALQFSPDLLYLAQADGTVRTLAPAAVAACAVQGPLARSGPVRYAGVDPAQVRLFRALAWPPARTNGRAEVFFFEQLSGGPVLLVRRPRLVQHAVVLPAAPPVTGSGVFGVPAGAGRNAPPPQPAYGTLGEVQDAYYLARAGGEIRPLRPNRKELLAAFPQQAGALNAYLEANRVTSGRPCELTEFVNYANSLAAAPATP